MTSIESAAERLCIAFNSSAVVETIHSVMLTTEQRIRHQQLGHVEIQITAVTTNSRLMQTVYHNTRYLHKFYNKLCRLSEWVSEYLGPAQQITGHFEDDPFEPIACAGTGDKKQQRKWNRQRKLNSNNKPPTHTNIEINVQNIHTNKLTNNTNKPGLGSFYATGREMCPAYCTATRTHLRQTALHRMKYKHWEYVRLSRLSLQ